jgi:hypothetical protein
MNIIRNTMQLTGLRKTGKFASARFLGMQAWLGGL